MQAWKYLIADKIEFNMKSIYETKAISKKLKKEHSTKNQSFMHLTIASKCIKQLL